MPIKDTIKKLDELRDKATPGEWDFEHHIPDNTAHRTWNSVDWANNKLEDASYIAALHNSYESLRKAALAGEALANNLYSMPSASRNDFENVTCYSAIEVHQVIAIYHKAIEE